MIAYLKGKLAHKDRAHVIIDVNGVGYEVKISLQTYASLADGEESCKLFTHLQVKEDSHTLVGFHSMDEKLLFLDLISVSGIGLSTALVMLSSFSSNEIRSAIMNENIALIQSIKGIGSKSAQRVILELKDKCKKDTLFVEAGMASHDANYGHKQEALSALVTLGIPRTAAEKSLDTILKSNPDATVENLIKLALR
ncbi:Holliday junction branch migration protein RuvA [Aquirufa lenticrescens]|uniref:Holliday junction branch migration protein RuvA n=1 Tax=Aquirufa lenticrescens TaxID=2696560 RepID=UPI001CAA7146|nr:Holliday junction branch migration protein RuvA [Aquirufa lenticrescens]UAJ15089.1 Holliday junction branch migration protein RuvA [Aquirufa lenticrescens]